MGVTQLALAVASRHSAHCAPTDEPLTTRTGRTTRPVTSSTADPRRAAESWFLDHGLPSVVTQRARLMCGPARPPRWRVRSPRVAIAVVVALLLSASGIGSVLGWALQMTVSQFAALGELMISSNRLWLALTFLVLIASAFVRSGLHSPAPTV